MPAVGELCPEDRYRRWRPAWRGENLGFIRRTRAPNSNEVGSRVLGHPGETVAATPTPCPNIGNIGDPAAQWSEDQPILQSRHAQEFDVDGSRITRKPGFRAKTHRPHVRAETTIPAECPGPRHEVQATWRPRYRAPVACASGNSIARILSLLHVARVFGVLLLCYII